MAELIHENERRPLQIGRSLFDAADELDLAVPTSCRRTGRCRECVVQVLDGAEALNPPTPAEEFLPHGFRLACQALVERGDRDVRVAVLRRRLRILTSGVDVTTSVGVDGAEGAAPTSAATPLDPPVTRDGQYIRYAGELIGRAAGRLLGLAIDVGTTTVVFELVDLEAGRTLDTAAFENPQRFGGSDVMSRIGYDSARPGELRRALRRALNRELEAVYRGLGVDRREVWEAVVVGNPTMRDLFFGLDVAPLGRSPFRSVSEVAVREGRAATTALLSLAHQLGLLINPQGRVYGVPIVACHVGADTAADLVATDFANQPGTSMLVDIGTNSEVVVGDGRRLLTASCPAGPAFEGGGIRYGMASADGAIESLHREGARFSWRTIGGLPPEGLCGSGLVDLLAESVRAGLLLGDSRLAEGKRAIVVDPERGIEIDRADVSNLAQAKAANSVGQSIVLRRMSLRPDQVDRVFLAGAFANALDVRNSQAIGLLAQVPRERVIRVGNASIRGAKALLLSARRRRDLEAIVARVEHVELESEADFFDLFVEACQF